LHAGNHQNELNVAEGKTPSYGSKKYRKALERSKGHRTAASINLLAIKRHNCIVRKHAHWVGIKDKSGEQNGEHNAIFNIET